MIKQRSQIQENINAIILQQQIQNSKQSQEEQNQ